MLSLGDMFCGRMWDIFFLSHLQVLFHTLGWFNRIYRLIFLARHLFHVQLLTQNSSRHFLFKDNEKWKPSNYKRPYTNALEYLEMPWLFIMCNRIFDIWRSNWNISTWMDFCEVFFLIISTLEATSYFDSTCFDFYLSISTPAELTKVQAFYT